MLPIHSYALPDESDPDVFGDWLPPQDMVRVWCVYACMVRVWVDDVCMHASGLGYGMVCVCVDGVGMG